MSSRVITPGPYRATKLWNEVTRLFRAGMPLKKHRQNFRHHPSCFTASAAVDWLHQLLCSNSNFGPDVTRQQTLQLLKKFLKNHVIEDVKGRWGTEELEDNSALYRFPSTSPLKPITCPALSSSSNSINKRHSLRDRDGFFKFRGIKKQDKEDLENVSPSAQQVCEDEEKQAQQRRQLTEEDERDLWRDITLTHLQRILGVPSLGEVLDPRYVNPENIIHNMTKVNKHGVVTLDNKTNDLPHWVVSAMKSLANWPKYDSAQPSYPGFERDVFKIVSDYFYSLQQPLLTYELYELFINVLVLSGYIAAPATHQLGKRKKLDLPLAPPPAKMSFRSTECLLLSLLRQRVCEEAESPMGDVIGGRLRKAQLGGRDLGGSCTSLSTLVPGQPRTRSCSLENVLDAGAPPTCQQLFLSSNSLQSQSDHASVPMVLRGHFTSTSNATPTACYKARAVRSRLSPASARRSRPGQPSSVGSCLDIVMETEEDGGDVRWQGRARSCLDVNAPSQLFSQFAEAPPLVGSSHPWPLPAPAVVRRCFSSLDVSVPTRPLSLFKAPVCAPACHSLPPRPPREHSILQPQCERVAIEALQLCTLLLPPPSRRKLQLLMRMMLRISQNVDMPRLHPAISTRTLVVHTFSGCILGGAEECDLDELLATKLVSFLMDHQQSILSVPEYLLSAITAHIHYLHTAQVPVDSGPPCEGDEVYPPVPVYAFCRQISGAEFEQQKLESSQKAMEELLEILLTDENMSEKDRSKKLKKFQKQYPDIYRRRFPCEKESKPASRPKIKPALLSIKRISSR
ncbi:unnamed protein product [Ophioblennius macclurei]